ncbi:MAG: molybdopterin-dependent oxidoreductase, partial [Aquabacterium sp.]|nr:molybdopterin-dependent oxidoreductase [Aquabacterium sp.]
MTQETRSTCPYCGVGCGVIIESQGEQITGVRGDPEHPANFGRLCTKGSTLHLTASRPVTLQTRLLQPMRRAARGAAPQTIGWDAALDEAATRLGDIVDAHGPDAVGLYISGQLLTEDYYVFNKLAKGLIGSNNIDTNSRLCMSSAVAGYKATLGADAPPACYDDLRHAGCVFIVGSNAYDNNDGTWRYEYAVFNLNSDFSGQSFRVDLGTNVNVTDIGMSFPEYHSGEPYTNGSWAATVANDEITWETET